MEKDYFDKIENFLYNHRAFDDNSFGCFSKMYSMTTENIYGFLSKIDLNDKKVLTVTGSGDQLLNSYLLGAKDVTCFDINPNSFCNTKLKVAAIKNIVFDDFLAFFKICNYSSFSMFGCLDYRLFEKLKPYLDEDTIKLYSLFYKKFGGNIYSSIYHNYYDTFDKQRIINGYMNNDSYHKLANRLDSVELKFIESNILNIKDKIKNEKFDIILLSNISDYISDIYGNNALEKFRFFIDSLMDNLSESGLIQVGYMYSNDFRYSHGKNIFTNELLREEVFTPDLFSSINVDSYDTCGSLLVIKNYDKVIIRKKC